MDIDLIKIQNLHDPLWEHQGIRVGMLRLDLLHPQVSGNKWFKLRYNIQEAQAIGKFTILTFGGAYSNHLYATAFYCQQLGIPCIGIVRGEELNAQSNTTLMDCSNAGMQLIFVNRNDYQLKENTEQVQHLIEAHQAYVIPEGGDNELGVKGAALIMDYIDALWTHIAVSVGSGTTAKGLLQQNKQQQHLLAFTSFKNPTLLNSAIQSYNHYNSPFELISEYGMGGFGKTPAHLIAYIEKFQIQHQIPLDIVYTGKMMFGLEAMIRQQYFPEGSQLLAIHTGGLQGNHTLINL